MRKKYNCGVLLANFKKNPIEILLVCKKYTYPFICFITGRYNINSGIPDINLKKISKFEKYLLSNYDFEQIYDLYFRESQYSEIDQRFLRKRAIQKKMVFSNYLLKFYNDIKHFFSNLIVTGTLSWDIPNGRKKQHESDLTCALRELKEETSYTPTDLSPNPKSYLFEFYNSIYITKYFLGTYEMNKMNEPNIKNIDYSEISNVMWFSIYELPYIHIKKRNRLIINDFLHEIIF